MSDLIVCIASTVLVFAVSVSTAFSSPVLQVCLTAQIKFHMKIFFCVMLVFMCICAYV